MIYLPRPTHISSLGHCLVHLRLTVGLDHALRLGRQSGWRNFGMINVVGFGHLSHWLSDQQHRSDACRSKHRLDRPILENRDPEAVKRRRRPHQVTPGQNSLDQRSAGSIRQRTSETVPTSMPK